MSLKDFFLGKRIAVIGLGLHGEMAADVRFLVKANALVSVYDLQTEARLGACVTLLRSVGLANCITGSVPHDDLLDMDLIILSHEYPRSSSFLAEAHRKGIQIEYPETLFLKLAPPVTVAGIMGSCGKSTILSMLAPMLETVAAAKGDQTVFSIDAESEDGILAALKRVKSGDTVAMRIPERMMPEICALKWSPHVAIFTTVPAAGSYKQSPFEILAHQTYNNYVIGSDHVIDAVRSSGLTSKAKLLRTKPALVPEDWMPKTRTPHDLEDAALALQAARVFRVPDDAARAVLSRWKPLRGRLELVKKVKGVEFWNDAASVSPAATIAGLQALSTKRDAVLILGGADRGADYRELYAALPRYAHTVVLLPGSGTLQERQALRSLDNVSVISAPSLEEAVRSATDHAAKGDKILYSPAFEAGGVDRSRHERGERFVRAVRGL